MARRRQSTGLEPIDYTDTERLLVHELLHVVLCESVREECCEAQTVAAEQAVEALTLALVGLARERDQRSAE